jgi:hypothetical protein
MGLLGIKWEKLSEPVEDMRHPFAFIVKNS